MSKFQDPGLKWAHRHDPFAEVKVLHHGFGQAPIVSVNCKGGLYLHADCGLHIGGDAWDLVPLQDPPLECWANVASSGLLYLYHSEMAARDDSYEIDCDRVAVRMREYRDE